MENDFKFLTKSVRFARKNGLKSLKMNGIELEFFSPNRPPINPTIKGAHGLPLGTDERLPTDDEMLMYSTESFDHMRLQRESAAKEKN
jgi:hypothetical protein